MMRDRTYQSTRLGKDVVAYLKWKRLSRAAERTLDQYERDLRLICLAVGCGVQGVTHADLMLVLEMVPEKSWKRVRAAWKDFFKWAVAEGMRPDNPCDRLPKLRPTPPPVYDDLWRQDELDLLVAATRRMDMPLIQKLRVLTMIESGGRAAELRGIQLGTSTSTAGPSPSSARGASAGTSPSRSSWSTPWTSICLPSTPSSVGSRC
jgi:site-specific recombinase XerD